MTKSGVTSHSHLGGYKRIFGMVFTISIIFIFLLILSSFRGEAAPPNVGIIDNAPLYVNESSPPVCVLGLLLSDDDGAILQNITVTVEGITPSFDPNTNLNPLTGGNLSGIMLYEETNAITGFQANDSSLGVLPTGWIGSGPWYVDFYGISKILPNATTDSNYYIVIRTSSNLLNEEKFMVGIEPKSITTSQGNIPSTFMGSKEITTDSLIPYPIINVLSQNPIIKIGDWMNITVSITGDDATSVWVNLTNINGLSESEPMTYDSKIKLWFYNITSVEMGFFDTGASAHFISANAVDKAGKMGFGGNFTKPIDTGLPAVIVIVTQEMVPGKVGTWINISVTTDADVISVLGDLSVFSGYGKSEPFQGSAWMWYLNFTVQSGTLDGLGFLNVSVTDDAGNYNYNGSQTANVDEEAPRLNVTIFQKNSPAGVGDWINITVTTHTDVVYMEANLGSAGFTGQFDNQTLFDLGGGVWFYYFTISEGNFKGSSPIEISAVDDLGQIGRNSTEVAQWDEIIPRLIVIVNQESSPAGIGDWINISVNTDLDVISVDVDLGYAGFFGQMDDHPLINMGYGLWYYNFTILAGSFDGTNSINIDVRDDAGNSASKSSSNVSWDESQPSSSITITQESDPLGIGDWINITVYTDSDTVSATADLASAGFTGQLDDQPLTWSGSFWFHQFTISEGTFDGSASIALHLADDAGNTASNTTLAVSWDEISPTSTITITQESTPAAVGAWVNISVETESDVQWVLADLAQAGFSNQIDDQPLIRLDSTKWYYLFTVQPGLTDASLGNLLNVMVMDDAGNSLSQSSSVYFDEVIPEPVSVNVLTPLGGLAPLKIGDWFNITVDMGDHEDISAISIDAPGLFSSEPITKSLGNIWYLNTTLLQGNVDGLVQFIITVADDANNVDDSKFANVPVDNIPPMPFDIIIKQEASPAKIGNWINISLIIPDHNDIRSIRLEAQGVNITDSITDFSGDIWFLNTTIPQGTADGEVQFSVTVTDKSGNSAVISDSAFVKNIPLPRTPVTPDEGMPLGLIIMVGCAAALSVGAVVVAGTEIGHYTLFFIFYFMYTRIKKEYILDNFTRGRIYGYIEANPGEHFNAIKRALDLKNGSLAYHLRTLEKREFIVSKRDRGYTRFYPRSMKLPKKNVKELIPIQRNILDIVTEDPGISQRGIAEKMKISYQLVHYHIKVLQDSNYLYLKKDKKQTYCYDSEEYLETSEPVEV